MFFQKQIKTNNSQKRRLSNYVHLTTASQITHFNYLYHQNTIRGNHLSNFHYFVYALTGGFLQAKTIHNFFSYSKKLLKTLKKSTKIWINLPVAHIITKKPLNTRMGKGKGSRQGLVSRIWPGALVFAIAFSRFGLIKKLFRFIKSKCPFRVSLLNNHHYFFNKTGITKNFKSANVSFSSYIRRGILTNSQKKFKLTLKRRIHDIIYDIFNLLTKIKKMKLLLYFYHVFPLKPRRLSYITPLFFFKNVNFYNSLFFLLFNTESTPGVDAYALLRLFSKVSKSAENLKLL